MLDQLNWVKSTLVTPDKQESLFTFALLDEEGKVNWALRSPCYMFGKVCTIIQAQSYVQHCQCEQCFMLTHHTPECKCPTDYKQCGICGISGHTQQEHSVVHCHLLHPMVKCDCDPTCFNCTY